MLVEGGPKIHSVFLARNFADVIYRYRGPENLGTGLPSALNSLLAPTDSPGSNITLIEAVRLGPDLLERFEIKV